MNIGKIFFIHKVKINTKWAVHEVSANHGFADAEQLSQKPFYTILYYN